ncbi:MAG: oligosaccharide flippase family protein, partial [Candidatus Undinarchaeales archaeon]
MNSEEKDEALKVFAKGAGIVFIGMVIGSGIGYFYRLLAARLLGPFEYGLFTLGLAVFLVLSTIASIGLPKGVARYVAFYRGKKDTSRVKGTILITYKLLILSGVIFSVLFFSLSEWLSVS